MPSCARTLVSAAFAGLLLGQSGPAHAQRAPGGCDAPTSQAALNGCAADDFARADAALNAAWGPARQWAERMDERAREEEAAGMRIGPPGFGGLGEGRTLAEGLLDAQRGWLRYRDGHCAAQAAPFSGGSIWSMLFDGCRARLTRDRTEELRALVLPPDRPGGSDVVSAAPDDHAPVPGAVPGPDATAEPVPERSEVSCLFAGEIEAVPCTMRIAPGAPEARVTWTAADGRVARFQGSLGDGWWFGTLDGAAAAGHELNRGNVAFSTRDRTATFQFWSPGHEHGTY